MPSKWFVYFWDISESELAGPFNDRDEAMRQVEVDEQRWDHAAILQIPAETVR